MRWGKCRKMVATNMLACGLAVVFSFFVFGTPFLCFADLSLSLSMKQPLCGGCGVSAAFCPRGLKRTHILDTLPCKLLNKVFHAAAPTARTLLTPPHPSDLTPKQGITFFTSLTRTDSNAALALLGLYASYGVPPSPHPHCQNLTANWS